MRDQRTPQGRTRRWRKDFRASRKGWIAPIKGTSDVYSPRSALSGPPNVTPGDDDITTIPFHYDRFANDPQPRSAG